MYTSLKEVEITRDAEAIREAYSEAFAARYHTPPFLEFDDGPVFSFLSKNFGKERGKKIAQHYVRMQDEWFLKNAHSAQVLKKNAAKVIADLGVWEHYRTSGRGLVIRCEVACDECGRYFQWRGDPSKVGDRRECGGCKK